MVPASVSVRGGMGSPVKEKRWLAIRKVLITAIKVTSNLSVFSVSDEDITNAVCNTVSVLHLLVLYVLSNLNYQRLSSTQDKKL